MTPGNLLANNPHLLPAFGRVVRQTVHKAFPRSPDSNVTSHAGEAEEPRVHLMEWHRAVLLKAHNACRALGAYAWEHLSVEDA